MRLGCSTFSYKGWGSIVYHRQYSKQRFASQCLEEYAQYRYKGESLFPTVGFDMTFYRPPTDRQLANYAKQLPPGFMVCSKVWERITVPQYAKLPEYGDLAGRPNPDFLNADLFIQAVLPVPASVS